MAILDTAALLAWPIERISGGIVAVSQLQELEKVSTEKALLIESIGLNWVSPDVQSIKKAKDAAAKSGDVTKLSPVDIDLIALCFQFNELIFTDDYRIQNTLTKAGMEWSSVLQKGITGLWVWLQVCTGCGKSIQSEENAKQSDCNFCGSPLKLKKKKK